MHLSVSVYVCVHECVFMHMSDICVHMSVCSCI